MEWLVILQYFLNIQILYSNGITNITNIFLGRNNSKQLKVYVLNNSITLNTFLNSNNFNWTNQSTKYYDATQNIYLYTQDNIVDVNIYGSNYITANENDYITSSFGTFSIKTKYDDGTVSNESTLSNCYVINNFNMNIINNLNISKLKVIKNG